MEIAREKQLLADAFAAIKALLAEGPGLELNERGGPDSHTGPDAFWEVHGDQSSYFGTFLVEAFAHFTPRVIDRLVYSLSPGKLNLMHNPTVLVVAPWLSPRARNLVTEHGWSYLDLTGNVLIRMARPALYIRTPGADRDPSPRDRSDVLLRGDRINALVRLLVDVEPPYRLVDLASTSGLSKGYLSRALTALHNQRLIDRADNGVIQHVDWAALLRQRAEEYDLFKSNKSATYLARSGPAALLKQLPRLPTGGEAVVTGSFAVPPAAQVAAPAQLILYVPSITAFAEQAGLIPAKGGANVALLDAASPSQTDRPRLFDGIRHVGLSQLVMDLLRGNGRLPEEGEAVLEWMIDTPGWRLNTLPGDEP